MAQKHKVWCDGGPHGNVIFPAAIFHGGLTKNYDLFYFYSRFFLRTSLPHTYIPRYILMCGLLDFYISLLFGYVPIAKSNRIHTNHEQNFDRIGYAHVRYVLFNYDIAKLQTKS